MSRSWKTLRDARDDIASDTPCAVLETDERARRQGVNRRISVLAK